MKLSYPSGRKRGEGPPRALPGLMHNDYAVSVARMLRLNLYVRERERERTMYAEATRFKLLLSQIEIERERGGEQIVE